MGPMAIFGPFGPRGLSRGRGEPPGVRGINMSPWRGLAAPFRPDLIFRPGPLPGQIWAQKHQIGAEWGRHASVWADTLRIHGHSLWHASGALRGLQTAKNLLNTLIFMFFGSLGFPPPSLLGPPIVPLRDARCYCHPIVPFAGCRYVAFLPTKQELHLKLTRQKACPEGQKSEDVSGACSEGQKPESGVRKE